MLTERRRKLLRYIVDEYVGTAQPVGSETVVRRYGLPISPATVRSEMMRLEEEGYLAQPHTSAGRVPSDKGYRYYVESLMPRRDPPEPLKHTIRHQFHQASRETEGWAHLAASILALRLRNVAVVTVPQAPEHRLRWLELVSLHDLVALLILVMQEGRVLQQVIPLEQPLSQDQLTVMARRLTGIFAGLTAQEIRHQPVELTSLEAKVVQATAELLAAEDASTFAPTFLEGLRHLLKQPEFRETERVIPVLDLLEESNLPKAIPLEIARGDDVAVIIGQEHPNAAMRTCSVVMARYRGPGGLRGTVGVIGPTRMDYARAVSLIRYISSLMGEMLEIRFG